MLNPFADVDWNPDLAKRRSFGKSLVIGFPSIALALFLLGSFTRFGWSGGTAVEVGGVGAIAGALFFLIPWIAKPFYIVWYFLACAIGLVVGNVVMGATYWVLIGGVGVTMRVFGRKPLGQEIDRSAPTYWLDAGASPEPRSYYHQS